MRNHNNAIINTIYEIRSLYKKGAFYFLIQSFNNNKEILVYSF